MRENRSIPPKESGQEEMSREKIAYIRNMYKLICLEFPQYSNQPHAISDFLLSKNKHFRRNTLIETLEQAVRDNLATKDTEGYYIISSTVPAYSHEPARSYSKISRQALSFYNSLKKYNPSGSFTSKGDNLPREVRERIRVRKNDIRSLIKMLLDAGFLNIANPGDRDDAVVYEIIEKK